MSDGQSDLEKLRAFAQAILDDWPDIGGLDGFEVQELAEKHGLLTPTIATGPCGETCLCAEYDDFPMTCYHKTATLTGEQT